MAAGLVAAGLSAAGVDGTRVLAPPYCLDGARPPVTLPPPKLGADTETILAEIGVSPARVAALRGDGIIG